MMLTKEHLRFRYLKQGWVEPCFIYGPSTSLTSVLQASSSARKYTESEDYGFVYDYVGKLKALQGQPFLELDSFVATQHHLVPTGAQALGAALKKIVMAEFLAAPPPHVREQRAQLLAYADTVRAQHHNFDDYVAHVARQFAVADPQTLRREIYGDLELARPIELIRPMTPQLLAAIYNLELAQVVMFVSHHVRFTVVAPLAFCSRWLHHLKLWGFHPQQLTVAAAAPAECRLGLELHVGSSKETSRKNWKGCLRGLVWPPQFEVVVEFYPQQRPAASRGASLKNIKKAKLTQDDFSPEPTPPAVDPATVFAKIIGTYPEFELMVAERPHMATAGLAGGSALVWLSPGMAALQLQLASGKDRSVVGLDIFGQAHQEWLSPLREQLRQLSGRPQGALDVIWIIAQEAMSSWQPLLRSISPAAGVWYFRYEQSLYGVVSCANVYSRRDIRSAVKSALV